MRWIIRLSHLGACLSIAAITVLILLQIAGRLIDSTLRGLGADPLGFSIPSLAEICGFLLVPGVFLALASTLIHDVHIRVTLLIDRLPNRGQRIGHVAAAGLGAVVFGWAAWHALALTRDSIRFDERSYGIVPVPLALPQSMMTLGLAVFALAFVWQAFRLIKRQAPFVDAPNSSADKH